MKMHALTVGDVLEYPTYAEIRELRREEERPRRTNGTNVFNGNCAIQGLGHWAPEQVRSTKATMDTIVAHSGPTAAVDVEAKTGVKELRMLDAGLPVTDMAMKAVESLYADGIFTGVPERVENVDVLIYCGVSRECLEPATAVILQRKLGIHCTNAFDVSNACLSFLDGMCIANALITSNQAQRVLVVAAEIGTHYNKLAEQALKDGANPSQHFASLTLGDGAVAALITAPTGHPNELVLKHGIRQTYGEHADLCVIPEKNAPMITDPGKLFTAALSTFVPLVKEVMAETKWDISDVDLCVPHQASEKAIKLGMRSISFPMAKTALTLDRYGNMASVSLPFSLCKELAERDDASNLRNILLLGFGSGLGICVMTLQRRGQALI